LFYIAQLASCPFMILSERKIMVMYNVIKPLQGLKVQQQHIDKVG